MRENFDCFQVIRQTVHELARVVLTGRRIELGTKCTAGCETRPARKRRGVGRRWSNDGTDGKVETWLGDAT